ncbi:hypothetical protein COS12_03285 [Candidatus Roizmanbacteria bacterium CG01_land_8_20_14_3_00_33_9]|uniref:Uncharacterized protein n=4 Tax=Candidatus Roizmaniibacteriota TaxID=1752723 RepID=A0A2M7E371_9BACT|nr:MAG: hypothetical protein COS12_03285 [Candidatus Roizmanbacteria bacterium CG01_land_8_20_14_3_00_33_9]
MLYSPHFLKQLFHNTRRTVAKHWLNMIPATQIALTGSFGKTTTTNIIYKLLCEIYPLNKISVTDINLDTTFNVPITALKIKPWTKVALFELGVDHVGEMSKHLEIVHPQIAIITGITPVHTDKEHFGSLENLIKEKRKLLEALPENGYAILNYDDEIVRSMAKHTKAKILWYGSDPKKCDLWTTNVKITLSGTSFNLHSKPNIFFPSLTPNFPSTSLKASYLLTTKLIGLHHTHTIMASVLTMIALSKITQQSISFDSLIKVIKTIAPLQGRMNLEKGPMGTIVLNDSLRANPASTASGLKTLSGFNIGNHRKFAVLAEMGELQKPQIEHEKIGELIAKLKIDYLVSIGPWQKYTANLAIKNNMQKDKVFWVKDVQTAAQILRPLIKPGDLIYLKGSLLRHVNRILLLLDGKEVGCRAVLCPFYHPCEKCQYLKKGFNQ